MAFWIECFGSFSVRRAQSRVTLSSRKAQLLIGLLCAARHRRMPRSRMAALLWEYADADAARVNLRQSLAQIRRALGEDVIETDGELLGLAQSVRSDFGELVDALTRGDDAEASRIYQGSFLDGDIPEGQDLESAIQAERARSASLAIEAMSRELSRLGPGMEGERVAHALIALDPLNEQAHRHLMAADAGRGSRNAARARYDTLATALRRDLGTEPEDKTRSLMDRIRRGTHGAHTGTDEPLANPAASDSPERPAEPDLLLLAMEADATPDWDRLRLAAETEGAGYVELARGEALIWWRETALRAVAGKALELAKAGQNASFALVPAEQGQDAAVTRARRMAAQAGAQEVLISPDLAARLGLQADDGKPVPLTGTHPDLRPTRPFIGRALERAQIEASLRTARQNGQALVIHLCGEAGIGKTRLAAEIEAHEQSEGALILRVAFDPLGRGRRHFAHDLIAQLPRLGDTDLRNETDRAISNWLRETDISAEDTLRLSALSDSQLRLRMLDILSRTLAAASANGRLVVTFEDAHWMPPGADEFLIGLANRITDQGLCLLITERPHGADLAAQFAASAEVALTRLTLGPLPAGEARQLAESAAPAHPALGKVLKHAAGHPLFLLRLLEANWSEGALPERVTSLVLEQLEGLPAADRASLQMAAIFGRSFDLPEMAAVFPHAQQLRPIGDLLIATGQGLAFSHDMVRQAIYDAIPAETRNQWHKRAATHYRDSDPLRWAQHALLTDDNTDATHAACAAANTMISHLRLTAALAYVDAGLARDGDAEAIAELHSCRAGIRRTRSDLRGALEDYRAAHARAIAAPTRVAMLVRQALVHHRLGQGDEADRALDAAEQIADHAGLAGQSRAEIHEQRGNRAFVKGEPEACLSHHLAGLQAAEAAQDIKSIARAHGGLGDAHFLSGDLRDAFAHFDRAVSLAASSGLGLVHQEFDFMRCFTLVFAEPGPRVHLLADLSVESAVEAGAERAEMLARNVRAEIRLNALDLDGAQDDIDRIMVLIEADPEARFKSDIALLRGWLLLRAGDAASAFSQLEPHLVAARDSFYNGPTLLALGALTAPTSATRADLMAAADARVAMGAMASAELAYRAMALEYAAGQSRPDPIEHHLSRLHHFDKDRDLKFAAILQRVAKARFGLDQSDATQDTLRAELAEIRLSGLANVLTGGRA